MAILSRRLWVLMLAATQGFVLNEAAYGQPPSFEIVSVKPVLPGAHERFESYCDGGGRFATHGTPLLWSIKWAYDLHDYQMSDGWPAWLNAFDMYDIDAKAAGPVTEDECKTMVQTLFAERFSLRLRRQVKNVAGYALIVAKNGPKLSGESVIINGAVKRAASEREAPAGWAMPRLANYLANVRGVQRPVLDRTMLGGVYGFRLNFATRDGDDRPDIFTALPEQLGLRLQPIRTPVEMWFVDHVEKPSGN